MGVVNIKTAEEVSAEVEANLAESIRRERDRLLSKTDWTQIPDAPVDASAWTEYRQALRDITDQPDFPHNVIWPEVNHA